MRLRQYIPSVDASEICDWVNVNERVHALWCANRFPYPLIEDSLNQTLIQLQMEWKDEIFVAVNDDGEKVGFVSYSLNQKKEGFVKFVMTSPEYRGKGIGTQMLLLVADYAKRISKARALQLNVFHVNEPAIKCYSKLGFKVKSETLNAFQYKDEIWNRINMWYEF